MAYFVTLAVSCVWKIGDKAVGGFMAAKNRRVPIGALNKRLRHIILGFPFFRRVFNFKPKYLTVAVYKQAIGYFFYISVLPANPSLWYHLRITLSARDEGRHDAVR